MPEHRNGYYARSPDGKRYNKNSAMALDTLRLKNGVTTRQHAPHILPQRRAFSCPVGGLAAEYSYPPLAGFAVVFHR